MLINDDCRNDVGVMMTPTSSQAHAKLDNQEISHSCKLNEDVFFGLDDLGRTFLTPSSSDASNLLLFSRTPFKHTRITPPQKINERQDLCCVVSNNNNDASISEDEDILFLNTTNTMCMNENVTSQTTTLSQDSFSANHYWSTDEYGRNGEHVNLPALRNEPKQSRHNHVPLLEPNVFDAVDAGLCESMALNNPIKDLGLHVEKRILDRFAIKELSGESARDNTFIEDHTDKNKYDAYRDEDTYIYNAEEARLFDKKRKSNSNNYTWRRNFQSRQTKPMCIDEKSKVDSYKSQFITTGNSGNMFGCEDDNPLKIQFVKCMKHNECRKPNKHVGRCKFLYDKA